MTKQGLTLIAALLDRSGSMQSLRSDTEGGFDAFVADQRAVPGEVQVTLAQFDDHYEVVYSRRPIAEVPPLQLHPRGTTALLDAIGKLVTDVGSELAALAEQDRPEKVIVIVMTDGHENSSREWTPEAVRSIIAQQEQVYSWEFLFLGANIDAVTVGSHLGFSAERSLTYGASSRGVGGAYRAASAYTSRSRTARPGAARPVGFEQSEREAAEPPR
ncbi:vWA domain-containing protein [Pseudonocardia sp. TRM90224]|uniref:vWA domain-containing protein n=1 Tax=Pseudonocardia sp. TRM90224 TaxID=2812678 RepID=UPI001E5CCE7E|nr:vWA domain-containing protein [Pseudonocardia sp. TRM90224]